MYIVHTYVCISVSVYNNVNYGKPGICGNLIAKLYNALFIRAQLVSARLEINQLL